MNKNIGAVDPAHAAKKLREKMIFIRQDGLSANKSQQITEKAQNSQEQQTSHARQSDGLKLLKVPRKNCAFVGKSNAIPANQARTQFSRRTSSTPPQIPIQARTSTEISNTQITPQARTFTQVIDTRTSIQRRPSTQIRGTRTPTQTRTSTQISDTQITPEARTSTQIRDDTRTPTQRRPFTQITDSNTPTQTRTSSQMVEKTKLNKQPTQAHHTFTSTPQNTLPNIQRNSTPVQPRRTSTPLPENTLQKASSVQSQRMPPQNIQRANTTLAIAQNSATASNEQTRRPAINRPVSSCTCGELKGILQEMKTLMTSYNNRLEALEAAEKNNGAKLESIENMLKEVRNATQQSAKIKRINNRNRPPYLPLQSTEDIAILK